MLVAGAGAVVILCGRPKDVARWQRITALACVLSVPVSAVAPQLMWRVATVVSPEESAQRLDYAELGLARAPVLLPRQMAESVRGAVAYVQAGTPQDAPFLAYPVAPLFNFLAERPNPTPFDHFLPATLSNQDFADVIHTLDRTRPRYVLWDHLGVTRWDTEVANAPLNDYIWRCYREVAAFRLYLVLERIPDAC